MNSLIRLTILFSLTMVVVAIFSFAIGAATAAKWKKSEVIPVVLVKPALYGYEPVFGSTLYDRWSKDEVKPVILVEPGLTGFKPKTGSAIGNTWSKDETFPVALVEPYGGEFISLGEPTSIDTKEDGKQKKSLPTTPTLVESHINGEFEGWEGETIVKLMNGQIWQQVEYHYEYHYAFMPKVTILKSGLGYKMWVEGVSQPVGVMLIK